MQAIEIPVSTLRREVVTGDAPPRVGITTLGCKVNTYESEFIAETLKTDSWNVVSSRERADLYIVNTCTVTAEADRQARQEVRRAIRRNPDALVVVTGCYAQMDPEACARIPGVDLVLGNDRKLDVHTLLPSLSEGVLPPVLVGDMDENISLPDQLVTGYEGRVRAIVQIQQGCDQGCTFCIIHRARGPSRSIPLSLLKRQVERLVLNGYREIVLCGVDLGSWGVDIDRGLANGLDIVDLIRALLSVDVGEDFRLRLGSIDPAHISNEFIDLMAEQPRLCRHLHLSLQSGNTLILKRMKRRYTAEHVLERVGMLRERVPGLVLSADVMTGFPTETDDQFEDTFNMLRNLDIAFPHVFAYSERSGTPAARIPVGKQVPVEIRKSRASRLRELGAQLQEEMLRRYIGTENWLLTECEDTRHPGYYRARAENYLPAMVKAADAADDGWYRVRYTTIQNGALVAESLSA